MSDVLPFFVPSLKDRVVEDAKDEINDKQNKENLLSRSVQVIRRPSNEDIPTVSAYCKFESCSNNPDSSQFELHDTTAKCKMESLRRPCGGFPCENCDNELGNRAHCEGGRLGKNYDDDPNKDKDDDDVINVSFCSSPRTTTRVRLKVYGWTSENFVPVEEDDTVVDPSDAMEISFVGQRMLELPKRKRRCVRGTQLGQTTRHQQWSVMMQLLLWMVVSLSLCSALHIEPELVCKPDETTSDKEFYVCSFRVQMSHELQGEEGQDIQTEAKQFLTACPQPGACVYSHITVKHPLPIQPVEQKKHQQNSNNKRSKPAAARTVTVQTGNSYESITTTATATTTTSSSSTTASSTAQSQPQTHLTVGEANYHPPYSQYGSGIEALLLRHYSKTTSTDDNAIPSWYIELGNAHLLNVQSTTTDSPKNDAMGSWYHAELAINAYHQARRHLERKQQSQQGAFQIPIHRELLATTHFQLGEAHASDPAFQHLSQAQEHFHTAKDMFTQLRYEYTEQAGNTASALLKKNRIPAMDKGYADTCTKLGMVLTNQAAANTLVPTGVMQIGGSGGNNNNIDLRDGLGAGFGGGGNDGGGVRVSGDMFGGAAQLDSLEELLAMMQNNQQYSAEAKLKTETQLKEAAEYLDEAIMIYEQYLYQNSNDDNHNVKQRVIITSKDRHDWQTSLGMAYQQAATTRVSGGHLIRAREFMNQGLDLYLQHILPYQNTHLAGAGTVSTNAIIGGFYVTLADTCLKLGDYDAAKENYEKSMIFHRDHGLAAPPFASFGDGEEAASQIDEVIQMHRQQLEEYRRLVKERMTGGSLYYMPQDDGYVAGMISAIGSMYLSKGELERGIGLLEEAIKMFAGVQNIKKNRRGFAEANMNLAMAYFQARRFEESQECHFKALDIFQELYGDGVNPLAQGMEDIEEFLEHAGLGDFADQIKIMLDGSAEEKSSTKVTVDIEKFKSSQKKNETATKPLFEEEKDKTETSSRGTEEL